MKIMRKFKISFILLVVVLLFTQCYKDNSNTEISVINPLVIDNSLQSTSLNVFQMDTIHVSPMVYKNGVEDANLQYEWKLSGNNIVPYILGNTMTLHAKISAPPMPTGYTLTLTVTDVSTSIQNFAEYGVSVSSSFGKGLIIADTKNDGQTSDLSLIMAENFSWNVDARNNRIFRNIYSSVNNNEIEGEVKGMMSSYHQHRTLTVYTDNSILRMDPYDYALTHRNNDIFFIDVPLTDFKPMGMTFYDGGLYEYMNMNGIIYPRNVRWMNNDYFFYLFTPDKSPYKISQGLQYSGYYESIFYYDELKNRFLINNGYTDGLTSFTAGGNGSFDANNVGPYDALYIGRGQLSTNNAAHAILKSETSDNYFCYSIRAGENDSKITFEPIGRYDLTNCENISQANYYECNPREDVIYYANENSIYSAVLGISGQPVSAYKRYTTNPGEVITGMKLWRASTIQGRMRFKDVNEEAGYALQSALYRMMVISTYNSSTGEGKIITIPIARLGVGELETDRSFHIEYGGFGRITTFEQQKN